MSPEIVIGIATVIVLVVTVFAIYYGPISALRIQRKLDERKLVKSPDSIS